MDEGGAGIRESLDPLPPTLYSLPSESLSSSSFYFGFVPFLSRLFQLLSIQEIIARSSLRVPGNRSCGSFIRL